MRQAILSFCLFSMCLGSVVAEEPSAIRPGCPKAPDPAYDSREATVLSMMGWGVGLFAGIAILCSLMKNNPEKQ